MSLRLRLLIILAPLFALGLVAADVVTYISLQSFLVSRVDQQLVTGHPGVEAALDRAAYGDSQGPDGGVPASLPAGTYGELVAADGRTIAAVTLTFGPYANGSSSAHPNLPSPVANPSGGHQLFTVTGSGGISQYRVYVDNAQSGSGVLLVVAEPLDDVQATLNQLLLLEGIVSALITLVIVAATWVLVRRGLRPLERMGRTTRSIVASDLSRRVAPATERTEVGRLGVALNEMLAQLQSAFAEVSENEQRLRHFISDASHELRTPLTSMRGYAELLRRNPNMEPDEVALALRRLEEETTRMGILVDDLLLLARLDQGRPLERELVDLVAMAEDAGADARVADADRQITVSAVVAPVRGDEMRLRQALGNLIRNALVHTPPGTPVEITVTREAAKAVISIVDHGPGIPAGQTERIFRRFHRADPSRSGDQGGSGLGLSITAAVIESHNGRIVVVPTSGGGATFRVELPLVAEDA